MTGQLLERRRQMRAVIIRAFDAGARSAGDLALLAGIPRSRASYWVATARRAGWIPPARPHGPRLPLRGSELEAARRRFASPDLAEARRELQLAAGAVRSAEAALETAAEHFRRKQAALGRAMARERRAQEFLGALETR